jgi:hypothetical protein
MKNIWVVLVALVCVSLWVGNASLSAQEKKPDKPAGPGEKQPQPAEPKPGSGEHKEPEEMGPVPVGPEHRRLQDFAGTWKVEHKMWHAPDSPPVLGTGTTVNTVILDGLALANQMEVTSPEGTFKGHGFVTWNVVKQKYQGAWLDVYSYNGIDVSYGTYDEANKTWRWQFEVMGPSGQMMTMKSVTKVLDNDHMSEEMTTAGPDGKEFKMMEMTYTRTK